MPRLMFACFLLGGLLPEPEPTDYCATSYCAAGLTNVGCNPPPLTGGSECEGLNPAVKEITQVEIDHLLDKLNTVRLDFATGIGLPVFPTASRMPILQWDAELATQAGHNARSCYIANDQCHNTATYPNSGQSIAHNTVASDSEASTTDRLDEMIDKVAVEVFAYFQGRAYFSTYRSANEGGNLANVVNDRASKVGCAFQQWDFLDSLQFYLVCNFSDNLVEGERIYTPGEPGSDCTSSVSSKYVGLCEA